MLQDNEPVHTSHVAVSTAARCGSELLPHANVFPRFAPPDFNLFPTRTRVARQTF